MLIIIGAILGQMVGAALSMLLFLHGGRGGNKWSGIIAVSAWLVLSGLGTLIGCICGYFYRRSRPHAQLRWPVTCLAFLVTGWLLINPLPAKVTMTFFKSRHFGHPKLTRFFRIPTKLWIPIWNKSH